MDNPPVIVLALSKKAAILSVPDPHPIAWKEYLDRWVVVFEDGRKITFDKVDLVSPEKAVLQVSDAPDVVEPTEGAVVVSKMSRKKGVAK